LGRGSDELNAAASQYVAVRVTDMRDVDLDLIRFDFDLTLAVVLMHSDGTIYHRYGSRGPTSAGEYLSMQSLTRLLRDTLPEHRAHDASPQSLARREPPAGAKPRPAIALPDLQRRIEAGERIDCVHCHTINDAEHADKLSRQVFRHDELFVFPDPLRLGLRLDREQQSRIDTVVDDSPSARAGLRPGDELRALGGEGSVRTQSDVQWALHSAPFAAHSLAVVYVRDGVQQRAAVELPDGWKRCPPEEYAWRPYKWNLSPSPGFGGSVLDAAARARLGLPDGRFALRVQYIVDWGEHAHRGRAAHAAGLRKGDVVLSFAGKDDFLSFDHFHAWVALTRSAGEDTEIGVVRGGERLTLHYLLPR
jgi:hypothetical protein